MRFSEKDFSAATSLLISACIAFSAAQAAAGQYSRISSGSAPRNVIIMIGDGCGFNHIEAAGLFQSGTIRTGIYAKFPVKLSMSTYPAGGRYDPALAWRSFDYVDSGATESAAAATAMATGHKTARGMIGMVSGKQPLENMVERAERLGKTTGVVTSVQFTHATPAGFVAHNESRANYRAIANEMIHRSALEVIMGCGHPFYDGSGRRLNKARSFDYVGGKSTWRKLLAGTAGADADGDGVPDPWKLIQSRKEITRLAAGNTPKRVIGVVKVAATLQQARGGDSQALPFTVPFIESVPTLEEMTLAALNVLDDDPDGFFLMIEGGAIDWAAHAHQSGRMIEEQTAFDQTIEAVVEWVEKNRGWKETLLVITADHETGYLTGPGSGQTDKGPVWNPLKNNGPDRLPGMQWNRTGHTNSLVPFYAIGAGADLFMSYAKNSDPVRGPYLDNTDIAKIVFRLWP